MTAIPVGHKKATQAEITSRQARFHAASGEWIVPVTTEFPGEGSPLGSLTTAASRSPVGLPKVGIPAKTQQPQPIIIKVEQAGTGTDTKAATSPVSAAETNPFTGKPFTKTDKRVIGAGAAVSAGLGAAAGTQPTASSEGAILQTAGAGLAGAAQGAAVGGVHGAIAGGLTGLVLGGIQSYFGLKTARENRRRQEREVRRMRELQERQAAQARRDMQEQIQYNRASQREQTQFNRRAQAIEARWHALQRMHTLMTDAVRNNEELRQLFVQTAR